MELSNTWIFYGKNNKNKFAAVNSGAERDVTWRRGAECKERTIIRARKKESFVRVKEKTKDRKERERERERRKKI